MTRQILGSGDDNRPRTPTLAQYYDALDGKLPKHSYVVIVFFPGKVPNYSLIADHNFRVNIHQNSALYPILNESLSQWADAEIALSILPNPQVRGGFELALEDSVDVTWERCEWGYKINGFTPKTATTKATRK